MLRRTLYNQAAVDGEGATGSNGVSEQTPAHGSDATPSQEDLNRVAGKVRAEERARFEKQLEQVRDELRAEFESARSEPKPKKSSRRSKDDSIDPDVGERIAALEAKLAKSERTNDLNQAIARAGLDETGAKLARALFESAADDVNVSEWLGETVSEFGLGANPQGDTQTDNKKQDSPTPITDRAAPTTLKDYERITNPNDLTKEDHAAMLQKYGPTKYRAMVRTMAENYYRGKKVRPE